MAERPDILSSLAEEGDTLSPPEIVSHPKQKDLTTNQSSGDLISSSQNGVVEEVTDSMIPMRNPKSPTGNDSISISIADSLTLNKNRKETSFSDSTAKERGQESAKLNVGGGSVANLRFSEQHQKQKLEKIPVQALEIQVIDETALIGPISIPKHAFKRPTLKNMNSKEKENMADKKAANATRRGTKGVLLEAKKKNVNVGKIRYSREGMEALRFENMVEQRRMWKNVLSGLSPDVRKEYDSLPSSMQQPNIHFILHDAQGKKKESGPPDFGVVSGRGRWNHMNVYVH